MARNLKHQYLDLTTNIFKLSSGRDRTKVMLSAQQMGTGLIIYLYNENAHIGALALGEYDPGSKRTSTSVITRLGHKEDIIAQKAAYEISKFTKKPVCVIAGIHVDEIREREIKETMENASGLVDKLICSRFLSTLRMR